MRKLILALMVVVGFVGCKSDKPKQINEIVKTNLKASYPSLKSIDTVMFFIDTLTEKKIKEFEVFKILDEKEKYNNVNDEMQKVFADAKKMDSTKPLYFIVDAIVTITDDDLTIRNLHKNILLSTELKVLSPYSVFEDRVGSYISRFKVSVEDYVPFPVPITKEILKEMKAFRFY